MRYSAPASSAPRIVVVGAGPAGTRAAEVLVAAGLRPVVVDEAPCSGGQIYRRPPAALHRPARDLYGFEAAKAARVHAAFDGLGGAIDHRPETLVWGREGGRLLLSGPTGLDEVGADAVILATGAMDRIVPLPGWTRPGVYSLGGAQVILKHQACVIGDRPVFVGTGPLLYLIAWQYAKAGAPPAAVLDAGRRGAKAKALAGLTANPGMLAKGLWFAMWLRARGVRVVDGAEAIAIDAADGAGLHVRYRAGGRERTVDGDAVGLGYGLVPEGQLADLFGCRRRFDAGSRLWLPELDADGRTSVAGVYAAGDGACIRGADAAEAAGDLAALALLQDLGHAVDGDRMAALRRRLTRFDRFRRALETAFPYPAAQAAAVPDETVVCRCEVVRAGELRTAAADWGIVEMNRLKAITRCGMGRCQGRLCGGPASEILAAAIGRPVDAVGRLRAQPPLKPIPPALHDGAAHEAAE